MRPALLAAAVVLAAAAPAHAAYPGANGKLVFFQDGVGGTEPIGLAVADATGFNQSPNPLGPVCASEGSDPPGPCPRDPIWSPGGTLIAFGLGGTVATMEPDGSDVRRLPLTGFARVNSPAWSPDGSRIAFSAVRGKTRNVYVTERGGSAVIALTRAGGASPAWSTGNEIAFTRGGNLFRMPATGGKVRRLTSRGGLAPTWSPRGKAIAFVRRVKLKRKSKRRTPVLYRFNRTGKRLNRLTRGFSEGPSWTPNGNSILFTYFDGFNLTIRAVPSEGGRTRQITRGQEGRRVAVHSADQQPRPRP